MSRAARNEHGRGAFAPAPARLSRQGSATANTCSEGNAFGSGEASRLPQSVRAALVRDYVAKHEQRLAARRAEPAELVLLETDDAPDMMKCAHCGTTQPERERCGICGEHA